MALPILEAGFNLLAAVGLGAVIGRWKLSPMDLKSRELCRVGGDVAIPTPHRPGRAGFPHPVLHERVSLALA